MIIIGISTGIKHGHHDGAACIIKDGVLLAAAEEERFTLAKHARGELPRNAVKFCLKQAGLNITDVDYICSPLISYPYFDQRLKDYFIFHFGYCPKIVLYDHHICHAASTFWGSGFDQATILCMDNSGDSSSGLIAKGYGNKIEVINRFERTNSLGLFYGMMTQFLGFQMTNDEYKVMGLASYGTPKYQNELDQILEPVDLGYRLNDKLDKRILDSHIYTTDFSTRQECIFTDELIKILGDRRLPGTEITQRHTDIAASLQFQLEKIAKKLANDAIRETGFSNLCLAGGVALNCKCNMEILNEPIVNDLYVPPVPHDAGVALGAAILKSVDEGYNIENLDHAYWGPEYSEEYIAQTIKQVGASASLLEDPIEKCTEDLTDQKTIGWFQGRMEYGPRALGNRSIIADPRSDKMKDRINLTIKYREEFRPFCPSILYEKQGKYFDTDKECPFMNITLPANETAEKELKAVVHADKTARIQSINKNTNPRFHGLVSKFYEETNVPVLLNTSLNINEQPTVNSPLEALHTYFCSGLDILYLGNWRLNKSK